MLRTSSTSASASGMNRNKLSQVPLTATSKHKSNSSSSSSQMSSRTGPSTSSTASKKLRTELRRVMSDRVFKITRCSQQQLQTNSSNPNNLDQAKHKQPVGTSTLNTNNSNELLKDSAASTLFTTDSKLSSDTMKSPQTSSNDAGQNQPNQEQLAESNLANNSIEPRVELKDKSELVDYVTQVYNQAIDEQVGTLSTSVKRIVNAIRSFANSLGDSKQQEQKYMEDIFSEHLLKTNIQLKQKYKTDEERNSDRFRIESELQIILQIENYLSNTQTGRTGRVDEDCVWEIANGFRMLSQMFRERFKIERFLFTEIYANFHTPQSSEFILSLMEELGYDKEEQLSQLNNNNTNQTDSANQSMNQQNESTHNTTLTTASNKNEPSPFKTPISTPLKSQSNQLNASVGNLGLSRPLQLVGSLNNLFEEFGEKSSSSQLSTSVYVHSSNVEFDLDETSQSQHTHNNSNNDENDDLLPDLKKKKPVVRYTDFSSTTMRSIVVQKKKMRLKIRSPYKSPSKAAQISTNLKTYSTQRKSPRLKDRQILSEDTSNRKRQRTYLITDTPDHKQNSTIITTKQEKVRKRFSFQPMSSFPVVPDTPVKGKSDSSETTSNQSYHVIATSFPIRNHIEVTPKKHLSPRKHAHLLD